MHKKFKIVGKSVEKVDGLSLTCGTARFVADYLNEFKEVLYAKILFSPYAHAYIKEIDLSYALENPDVEAAICYKNVPRVIHTTAGQGYPEPSPYDTFMFDKKVRFVGDRVAAVAAKSKQAAMEALKNIKVEYEVLEPVLSAEHAMDKGAPVIHDEEEAHVIIPIYYNKERNHAAHVDMLEGDPEKAFKESDVVISHKYYSHYAQHCPIEPHVALGYIDSNGRLVIITSTQVPFHVRRIISARLEIPVKNMRVIKPRIGGGFGTKQEVLIEDVVGMLTLLTRKPVFLEYTRKEEFICARTRHPQIIELTTSANKDGTLTGIDLRIISNTGAYGSHGLTVVCNSGSKMLPLYRCNNIKFDGNAVYTNLPVAGAYRGYGATQSAFAIEVQIDELAELIGMDPLEFRKKNHIRSGDSSPVFQKLGEGKEGVEMKIGSCGLDKCIELGAKEIGWKKLRKQAIEEGPYRYGVGMACLMQGSSIPEIDMASVTIKMNEDGSFNLLAGATDLGTGSDTVLAQCAAEVLGVSEKDIIVYSSDTDMTPFDVGAYASSTTYLSGQAAIKAAEKIKLQIIEVASKILGVDKQKIVLENGFAIAGKKKVTLSDIAIYSLYESDQFQIAATGSAISHKSPPPFSAHFAYVRVDIHTGEVKVLKYVAAVDCGTAINPALATGQTLGAVLNGISFALTEEYIFDKNGKMLNPSFKHYKIYGTRDVPDIKVILVPTYEETGPFGAKSVSEISINGPMPAISNAIYNAISVRIRQAPFTRERVLEAIEKIKDRKNFRSLNQ